MRFLKGISEKSKVKKEGCREGANGVVIHIFEGDGTCVGGLGFDQLSYLYHRLSYQ